MALGDSAITHGLRTPSVPKVKYGIPRLRRYHDVRSQGFPVTGPFRGAKWVENQKESGNPFPRKICRAALPRSSLSSESSGFASSRRPSPPRPDPGRIVQRFPQPWTLENGIEIMEETQERRKTTPRRRQILVSIDESDEAGPQRLFAVGER